MWRKHIQTTWSITPHSLPEYKGASEWSFPTGRWQNRVKWSKVNKLWGTGTCVLSLLAGPRLAGCLTHSRCSVNLCCIWTWNEDVPGSVACAVLIIGINKWAFLQRQTPFTPKFTLRTGEKRSLLPPILPLRKEIRLRLRMNSGLYLCREVIRPSKQNKKVKGC